MTYQSFESLDVWKRACRLVVSLYSALEECRDFGLKDQMTRAAVSIPSNIAEGYERGSEKDFVRFVRIAQGSSAELRTQIYIAQKIGVIDLQTMKHLAEETKGISAMLQALANSRKNQVNEVDAAASVSTDTKNPIDD
jgi:four helix bundle protein